MSLWPVWILLSLLPFLPLTDTLILGRPEKTSRYLYPATAGTSLLLAWGLEEVSRRLRTWGRYVYPCALVAILLSSYYYLKQAEAITLYSSGRSYIALGDTDIGVEQLRRAVDQGPGAIDLLDAYKRICYLGMGKEGSETILEEALAAFPTSLQLTTYKLAFDSLKPDSLLSKEAGEQLDLFKMEESQVSIRVGQGGRVVMTGQDIIAKARREIAAFYHSTGQNLGTGLVTLEDLDRAILAYRRALEFDPDRMVTHRTLVTALASAGRDGEAVMAALEAVERNPDAPTGLQVTASFGLVASGRLEEAVALCHRALEDASATEVQRETVFKIYGGILEGAYGRISTPACVRMGMDLLSGGRVDEAVTALRQALAKDADNPRAHFALGVALLSEGQVEEAERLHAEGVERFGRSAAEESGAAEGLRSLIAQGIQVQAAREILATHWPEL